MVPRVKRSPFVPLGLALVLVGGAAGGIAWFDASAREEARERRERRRAERREEREELEERVEQESTRLIEASSGKMPAALEGVALGQPRAEVARLRPSIAPSDAQRADDFLWMEERLGNGAQILYAFHPPTDRLIQVQVLSHVPPRAVGPHLTAMNDRYGPPTGIWNCSAQSAAGVPTRRFTWREENVTVQDILLVHPGGVSLTLYVAPTEMIGASLQLGGCRPVTNREELSDLEVATPEQLQGREVQPEAPPGPNDIQIRFGMGPP